MRTTKLIRFEADSALEKYIQHVNDCKICLHTPISAEDEKFCQEALWLHEEYERLISEADYADQVFKAELSERKESEDKNKSCHHVRGSVVLDGEEVYAECRKCGEFF